MRDFHVSGIPELPERISVETRLISREAAIGQNLAPTLDLTSHSVPKKSIVSVEVMTDGPNPTRDRSLQTNHETNTIAIQCDLMKEMTDFDFQKHFENEESEDENLTNEKVSMEKELFLAFVKENIAPFNNGKLECLFCGEIKPNHQCMESHMALHWGPQKLCCRCGLTFEHKILWKKHNCIQKRPSQPQYIKCPHYFCAASLISPMELYDHLNEHCEIPLHVCSNCSASFPTADELRHHLKLHRACRKNMPNIQLGAMYNIPIEDTKYRKRVHITTKLNGQRVVVKRFLSQLAKQQSSNKVHYCNICLRRCGRRSHFHDSCLEQYRRRQKHKRIKAAVNTILLNGNSIEID